MKLLLLTSMICTKRQHVLLTLLLLAISSTVLYGGDYEVSRVIFTPTTTTSLILQDYTTANDWSEKGIKVSLEYGRQNNSDLLSSGGWEYSLEYDIKLYDSQNNIVYQENDIPLTIGFNTNGTGDFIDIYTLEGFTDLKKAEIDIASVTQNPSGSAPNDIQFSATIFATGYDLDLGTISNLKGDANGDELKLQWSYATGAESYEVQWLFVDEQFQIPGTSASINNTLESNPEDAFDKDFYNNNNVTELDPINIQTTDQHYVVNLSYPKGNLYYRVRPIGVFIDPQGGVHNRFGEWTYATTGNGYHEISTGFESDKTWSKQMVFAEDGKNKISVSYFDESLRPYQSLVNMSTDDNVLVSQTIYDFEGRPTVSVLPVPVNTSSLSYKTSFALVDDIENTGNDVLFGPDFVANYFEGSSPFPLPLSTSSGASEYYSAENDRSTSNNGVNMAYIPNAFGFPYVQTIYKNDNSGRVVSQSGLGRDHVLGSGHEIQYYYSTPNATKLHRLFGSDVGIASHYKEMITKDANGQFSIAYMDQENRVIATALLGPSPANVEELENYEVFDITVPLIRGNDGNDNEFLYESAEEIFNETANKTYYFSYDMTNGLTNGVTCYNCKYRLEIFITNEFGERITLNSIANASDLTPTVPSSATSIEGEIDQDCSDGTTLVFPSNGSPLTFTANLGVGVYKVVRRLIVVRDFVYDETLLPYLESEYGLPDRTTYINDYVSSISTDPCDLITDANDPGIPDEINPEVLISEVDEASCDAQLLNMQLQLQPGGYYFENELTDIWNYITSNNINNGWQTYSGGAVSTSTIFADEYNPDWVDDYIEFHPEYCHYEICSELAAAGVYRYEFNLRLLSNNAYTTESQFVNNDPLVIASGILDNYAFSSYLSQALTNYQYIEDVNSIATYVNSGGTIFDFYAFDNNPFSGVPDINVSYGSTTIINPIYAGVAPPQDYEDMQWDLIINSYIMIRRRLINDAIDNLSTTCNYLADEDIAVFIDPAGNAAMSQSDVEDLIDDQCREDAEIIANFWVQIMLDKEMGGGTLGNNPASLDSLVDTITWYIDTFYCGVGFEWPYAIPTDQVRSMCPNNDPQFGDFLDDFLTPSNLTLEVEELYPQWDQDFLDDYTESYTPSSLTSYTYPYTSASLYNLVDPYSIPATPSPAYYEEEYYYLHETVNIWMNILSSSCPNLLDEHNVDAAPALELIRALLTTYAMENHLVINRNLMISQEDWAACQNDYTLQEVDEILALFDCNINDALIVNEVLNTCPNIAMCGLDFVEMLNEEVFAAGTANTLVSTSNDFTTTDSDDYFPFCFDTEDDQSIDYDVETTTISGVNVHNISMDNVSSQYSDKIYMMNQCGDLLEWYYGMELSDPYADGLQGQSTYITIGSTDILFTGLSAKLTYPSSTASQRSSCHQDINAILSNAGKPLLEPIEVRFVVLPEGSEPIYYNMVLPCETLESASSTDCIALLQAQAEADAEEQWDQMLNDALNQYYQSSLRQCYSNRPTENFTATYQLSEYHYTLYYYDQAGHLIQTVPPEGVHPLDLTSATHFDQTTGVYLQGDPEHTLPTQYRYNSFGQLVWQKSPDGGETQFYYNDIGQLRYSQNLQQYDDFALSYTKYDDLGRPIEVGELQSISTANIGTYIDDLNNSSLPAITSKRKDITASYYNGKFHHPDFENVNYRNAISTVVRYDEDVEQIDAENTSPYLVWDGGDNNINATYYQYDEIGNVKTLIQQIEDFEPKTMSYEYDLLSGNVNRVNYQPGETDAFYHTYTYDADNRLTSVYTSRDDIIWEQDARYYYYPHGPLARVELGQDNVQGLDYYYTIHGWLKGINRPYTGEEYKSLTPTVAMDDSPDGITVYSNNLNSNIPRDEFTTILGYYKDENGNMDYSPIGEIVSSSNPIETSYTDMMESMWPVFIDQSNYLEHSSLYNGNIAMAYKDIAALWNPTRGNYPEFAKGPKVSAYKYDQLNRLVNADHTFMEVFCYDAYGIEEPLPYYDIGQSELGCNAPQYPTYSGSGFFDRYGAFNDMGRSSYVYDANGNIENLKRWDVSGALFDDIEYYYELDANGELVNNRLVHVYDDAGTLPSVLDIDYQDNVVTNSDGPDPSGNNYRFDNKGQLIFDRAEGLVVMWDAYGKVSEIINGEPILAGASPDATWYEEAYQTIYKYDAMGNRVLKKAGVPQPPGEYIPGDEPVYFHAPTYYVRDAMGNVMATYLKDVEGDDLGTEYNLYGSSQLGTYNATDAQQEEVVLTGQQLTAQISGVGRGFVVLEDNGTLGLSVDDVVSYKGGTYVVLSLSPQGTGPDAPYKYVLAEYIEKVATLWAKGRKNYALTDHLGNVNVVIGDERKGYVDGNNFIADILLGAEAYNGASLTLNSATQGPVEVGVTNSGEGAEWTLGSSGIYELPDLTAGVTYQLEVGIKLTQASSVDIDILDGSTVLVTENATTHGKTILTFDPPTSGDVTIRISTTTTSGDFNVESLRILKDEADGKVDYYLASIRSATDYYPFGMEMPGRTIAPTNYRYGFNGMEKDDEIKGNGNSYDFGARLYDSRLGRWWTIDPKAHKYHYWSPYSFGANSPISFVDVNGEDIILWGLTQAGTSVPVIVICTDDINVDLCIDWILPDGFVEKFDGKFLPSLTLPFVVPANEYLDAALKYIPFDPGTPTVALVVDIGGAGALFTGAIGGIQLVFFKRAKNLYSGEAYYYISKPGSNFGVAASLNLELGYAWFLENKRYMQPTPENYAGESWFFTGGYGDFSGTYSNSSTSGPYPTPAHLAQNYILEGTYYNQEVWRIFTMEALDLSFGVSSKITPASALSGSVETFYWGEIGKLDQRCEPIVIEENFEEDFIEQPGN